MLRHRILDASLIQASACRLYVPEELINLYKECIVPNVSLLTPNQFELQLLSGRTVASIADGFEACKVLHELGTESVVCPIQPWLTRCEAITATPYNRCLQL